MCVGGLGFVHINAGAEEAKGTGHPGAGVLGGCDPCDMGVGNQTVTVIVPSRNSPTRTLGTVLPGPWRDRVERTAHVCGRTECVPSTSVVL